MAIRTYNILLDSYNSTIPEPIVGRQGDKNGAVTLHVTVTDRGAAVNLTGQTINLIAKTAKGTAIIADNGGVTVTNAVGGKFDYAIPNALWNESGKITRAYFSLNGTDGQQTTYDLIFIIKESIDITQKHADDYVTIIDGTLRDLQTKVNAIDAAYKNGDFYNKSETDSKDVTTLSSAKAYTDNSLSGIVALPETFANLAAIQSKYPNGANGVMVAADNGHKYIWANSTWTDAGIYQAVGIADNSIMDKQITAPAKSGAYLLPTKPVDFDFANKIITISKGSLIGVGQKINDPLASDVLVPFSDNIAQILLFNQETKAFRAVATYETNLMTADEVILARYNTNPIVQRVSANFDYTVNGAPPDTGNIAGSKFISVIADSKITYDFVNKQVVVPASLGFFAANMHYYATDWNPEKIDLVIPFPSTGANVKLVFNQQTKSFSVLNFSAIITPSQTIVSAFNMSTELIVQFDNLFTKLSAKQSSNITEPLPGYVNAEISRVNDEVIALADPDKLIIAWQTDVHNYDSHIRALVQLQRLGQLDYIINGGDLSYESPLAQMRAKFDSQKLLMEPSQTPWVTIRGNHDGSGTDTTISEITNSEFNRRMNWNQTSKKMWIDDGTGNGYGYIDDDKHQIRMIFINNAAIDNEQQHRSGIDDVQLKWIIEHALDLSEKSDDEKNWQVLMFGHIPIDGAFTTGAIVQGADVLEAGIVAFKTGTIYINELLDISCDFKQPHTFIAFVNGHMHFDQLGINGQGFMEVCTASSQPDHFTSSDRLTPDATSPERTLNDVTEDCWDVLVIDPAQKHVDLVRYGAGENRKFDY